MIDKHDHDIFVIQMSFHVKNTDKMQNIKAYFVEQKIQIRSITGISDGKGFENKGITQQLHCSIIYKHEWYSVVTKIFNAFLFWIFHLSCTFLAGRNLTNHYNTCNTTKPNLLFLLPYKH